MMSRYGRLLILALCAAGCGDRLGPLDRRESRLALQFEARVFSSSEWRAKDRRIRGEMLASLMRAHPRELTRNQDVFRLLGPGECYIGYEDEPCYFLTLGETDYELQFPVNHSSEPGRVLNVHLRRIPPTQRQSRQ